MDVLRFINSNAVRDYLKEIDYQFNTLEAAYLVHDCRFATLEEKHEAFREILETMPDMAPEKEFTVHHDWGRFGDSVHKLIAYRMANENRWIEEFYAAKQGAYKLRDYYIGYERPYTYLGLFTELDAIQEFVSKTYADEDDRADLVFYVIIGKPTDKENVYYLRFNKDGELMSVDQDPYDRSIEDNPLLLFENMWFGFPTPFKKGDILYDPSRADSSDCWDGPFVLEETATELYERLGRKGCDTSDMTASGLFLDENNEVYSEVMHDYMALEYYPKEKLTGEKRILIALSNFKKGKIEETLLLNAYRTILLEEYAKKTRPHYTHEGMVLAGLEEENDEQK